MTNRTKAIIESVTRPVHAMTLSSLRLHSVYNMILQKLIIHSVYLIAMTGVTCIEFYIHSSVRYIYAGMWCTAILLHIVSVILALRKCDKIVMENDRATLDKLDSISNNDDNETLTLAALFNSFLAFTNCVFNGDTYELSRVSKYINAVNLGVYIAFMLVIIVGVILK